MTESFAGDPTISKAVAAASIANGLIFEMMLRCQKGQGTVYHYFDIGVVGFGIEGSADFAWRGSLQGRGLVSAPEIRDNILRIEERTIDTGDGAGWPTGQKYRLPVWLDPIADNGASLSAALDFAGVTLWHWVTSHPDSFPPIVLLITGGEAELVSFAGADPFQWAGRLKQLATRDGTLMLYNLYLSSTAVQSTLFPDAASKLPDANAEALFEMSSVLPSTFRRNLAGAGFELEPNARGFAVNSDIKPLLQALPIGTRIEMWD